MHQVSDPALILASGESSGGSLLSVLPLLLIFGGFIFWMQRSQKKRAKAQEALQGSIQIGDEIVTNSGIFGFVTGEDGPNRLWVEIDDDVQVRVARAAVQGKVDTNAEDDQEQVRPESSKDDSKDDPS